MRGVTPEYFSEGFSSDGAPGVLNFPLSIVACMMC